MAASPLPLLLFGLVFMNACRSEVVPAPVAARPTTVPDTAENRKVLAEQVVAAYPREEFSRDLARRVAEITGPEVMDEVRERLTERLRPEQVHGLRLKLYTEYFTTRQLELLRDLYATGDGRVILNNLRRLDEDLRERLKPLILEVLSNKPGD